MPSWLHWINNRVKNFDMLGSVWFDNLDIMVNNVRYLHDDEYEYQQPGEPYKSDQPNESKLGDKSANNNCTDSACGICNGTRPNCYCNYPINNGDKWEYTKVRKHILDSIDDNDKLYSKLSNTKYYDDVGYRESTRSTER